MKLLPLKCMEVFGKGAFIPAGTRAVQGPRHPAAPAHTVTRMRETVSVDSVESPNTGWCADLLREGAGEEEGEEEFIHQVSLRAQYVLHCWSGRQSQTG